MLGRLKLLEKRPESLNIIGKLTKKDEKNVVIIGSRNISSYGKSVIEYLVPQLIKHEYVIISGLAPGCDSYAHEIAIKSNGRIIGILGFGLNFIGKDQNQVFIDKVLSYQDSALISPFNRDQKPTKKTFIYRNYVMSALGNIIIVIEAGKKSGVFHTVNAGLDMGKDVYSVPGDIFRTQSIGSNNIIKEGGFLLNNIEDIINS